MTRDDAGEPVPPHDSHVIRTRRRQHRRRLIAHATTLTLPYDTANMNANEV